MTRKQIIIKELETYEDQCKHDAGTTMVLPYDEYDCEGGMIKFICSRCGETLYEGGMYE